MTAIDVDIGTRTAIILEISIAVEHYVYSSRYVIATIYVTMNINIIITKSRSLTILWTDDDFSFFLHITHKDVVAVYSLDVYVGSLYRTIETTT